jgi:hypothetical protein
MPFPPSGHRDNGQSIDEQFTKKEAFQIIADSGNSPFVKSEFLESSWKVILVG